MEDLWFHHAALQSLLERALNAPHPVTRLVTVVRLARHDIDPAQASSATILGHKHLHHDSSIPERPLFAASQVSFQGLHVSRHITGCTAEIRKSGTDASGGWRAIARGRQRVLVDLGSSPMLAEEVFLLPI